MGILENQRGFQRNMVRMVRKEIVKHGNSRN